ncbi:AraC family transcriptional regulator [Hymenobacter negativus]|uniref:Helix-turn-helix domain-containing protein n=1 Tax=Hymenobacter negativus TaxID=2795026 RepID=A0ABS3QFF7_9BACT|nr:AraC family transcriptional regulator [Hymenobacter negativus]MBO2009987.1 helix-turn-helix domain-containing protein [Hymenobacter negativus]
MKCHIQHEPLIVEEFKTTAWTNPGHLRNHFELISIRKGSGTYVVNNQHTRYMVGSLFLLGPADSYSFAIEQPTEFGVLRFTEAYLKDLTANGIHPRTWQLLRDYTLHASLGLGGSIILNTAERQHLDTLFTILFAEYSNRGQLFNDTLAESLMGAVLSFVGRQLTGNVGVTPPVPSHAGGFVQRLLAHIRRHISQPDCLRVERLAAEFAYSPKHLSALFKQETGESLRQYILRYKLKLVETRLLLSTLTISQIADELAFTDVCHLNKLFKKHYDTTPTDYRRHLATLPPSAHEYGA